MGLVDGVVSKFLKMKIRKINANCDIAPLQEFKDRSIAIIINDVGDNTGFGFNEGRIVEVSDVESPTVILKMSLRVFKALLAGKLSTSEIFYSDLVEAHGAHLMRDKVILTHILEYFREVGAI